MSRLPVGSFWAKLGSEGGTWHPLVAHSADVGAAASRLIEPGTVLARRLAAAWGVQELTDRQRATVIYVAALHDLGKANHGFQEKRYDRPRRRRFVRTGHVKVFFESLHHRPLQEVVRSILAPLGLELTEGFELLGTAICHHGRPWGDGVGSVPHPALLWDRDPISRREPICMIMRLRDLALRWSRIQEVDGAPPRVTAEGTHVLAGLVMLADWIGSTEIAFPPAPDAETDPDAYWRRAQELAKTACEEIGIVGSADIHVERGVRLLERLFPELFLRFDPTALQRHCAEVELPGPGTRILIESQTGSGKTEAALTLYARLRGAGLVDGLVFALPTRATARAMMDRVTQAVDRIYDGTHRPTVALAMGGEQVVPTTSSSVLDRQSRQYESREDLDLTHWASNHLKKSFAAEVVVGTIDQVLLSAMLVNHAHLRMVALSRHLVVLDELHSFDRYMSEVLLNFLGLHASLGGIVLFMSATLSSSERHRFGCSGSSDPTFDEASATPYPMVSVRSPASVIEKDLSTSPTPAIPDRRVVWGVSDEGHALRQALDAAQRGARVCVLRNLVRTARSSVSRLRELGGESVLWRTAESPHRPAYHSRYSNPDRRILDRHVLGAFGRIGVATERLERGVVLCSTQVVEQSLDVDFDYMITDLCPIDVLLQRIGRLHRHSGRKRPVGFEEPRILVIVPDEGLEPLVKKRGHRPNGWGTVYRDLGDLELTRRLVLESRPRLIPRDNRYLIESVYHPERREALREEATVWQQAIDETDGKDAGQRVHARTACLKYGSTYRDNADRWPGIERKIRTRLGDDRIRVSLPDPVRCCYAVGEVVYELDLPIWLLGDTAPSGGADLEVSDWSEEDESTTSFRVGSRVTVRYDPSGWRWQKIRAS